MENIPESVNNFIKAAGKDLLCLGGAVRHIVNSKLYSDLHYKAATHCLRHKVGDDLRKLEAEYSVELIAAKYEKETDLYLYDFKYENKLISVIIK